MCAFNDLEADLLLAGAPRVGDLEHDSLLRVVQGHLQGVGRIAKGQGHSREVKDQLVLQVVEVFDKETMLIAFDKLVNLIVNAHDPFVLCCEKRVLVPLAHSHYYLAG